MNSSTMQLVMSTGTLLLGLMLALVLPTGAAGTEFAVFGWFLVVLGAIGIVLRFVLPSGTSRPPRRNDT